jgi:hypothetical protein
VFKKTKVGIIKALSPSIIPTAMSFSPSNTKLKFETTPSLAKHNLSN